MAPQLLIDDSPSAAVQISGNYHNPDHSACVGKTYYAVYSAGRQEGLSISSNDCRACAKVDKSRQCRVIGGNATSVELGGANSNTGEWTR